MTHPRPFRFGVSCHNARSGDEWKKFCRRAERQGYDTLFFSDHFNDQLAPMLALTAAASCTTTLRVGTLVLDNDFRHPAVQAKEAATVDVLSGGRFVWGVGAGWLGTDYDRTGLVFAPGGERLARLVESVKVAKALFADGLVDFHGEHYTITGLEGTPKPVQRPHPPLLVGGAQPRILSFAAREADIIGVGPSLLSRSLFGEPPRCTIVEALDRQISWIREAAGSCYDQLELNVVAYPASVTDDRDRQVPEVAQALGLDPAQLLDSPHVLIGTVDQIVDALEAHRARWDLSFFVVPDGSLDSFAPVVERLAGR